ncbi:MAG: response regulator [Mariprofundus sp.]|nr:response regulator [Mariprofundus sp.]
MSQPCKRLLLVDDDHTIRMTMGAMMKLVGFDVLYAENGKKGLSLFQQQHGLIDLIITDVCMPEMNGIDMIRAIRMQDKVVPIIVITGFAESELLDQIEFNNATLFEKPIHFKSIITHIELLHFKHKQAHLKSPTVSVPIAAP